jgi:hypothetical protein
MGTGKLADHPIAVNVGAEAGVLDLQVADRRQMRQRFAVAVQSQRPATRQDGIALRIDRIVQRLKLVTEEFLLVRLQPFDRLQRGLKFPQRQPQHAAGRLAMQ